MKWNVTYSNEWFDKIDSEFWWWEEYSFLTINLHWRIPGLRCCKYDGIPYKILSFGLFSISWGKEGSWVLKE